MEAAQRGKARRGRASAPLRRLQPAALAAETVAAAGGLRRRLPLALTLPLSSLKLAVPAVTHGWAMFHNNINVSKVQRLPASRSKRKAYIIMGHIPPETGMGYGWMGGRGGWASGWPGRGPFGYLPPWQRPGWLYGRGACWALYGAPSWAAPWYWYRPHYAPPYSYYPYAAPYWTPYWYPPYR